MCFRPVQASVKENKCPKCGKVNEPEAKVCAECGEKLAQLPPPPGQAGGGAPPKPPTAPPTPPAAPPKPPTPPGKA